MREWARFYPYTAEVAAGGGVELKVMVRNHSAAPREFRVTPRAPAGWGVPKRPSDYRAGTAGTIREFSRDGGRAGPGLSSRLTSLTVTGN
jgi:hypothetical protein